MGNEISISLVQLRAFFKEMKASKQLLGSSPPFQFAYLDVNLCRGALIVAKFMICDQKIKEAYKLPDFLHCA